MSVESSKIIEGLAYEVTSHEFKVRVDVSEKLGGKNSAPNPHDYLEIALAGCTAITVQMYANRKGIPLQYSDVKITITAEGPKNEILREIKFVGDLTEEQKQSLFRIAEKCPLHNLISAGAKIETRIV
jgi:putative redox protein